MTDQETHATDHLISRRSALQLLTALAGAGAFSGAAVADDGNEEEAETEDGDDDSARPVGTDALLNYLAAKYGEILSEEDIDTLADDVAENVQTAQTLDAVDLANGDDMALVFQAYRGSH